jgi:hypothetical protein
VPDGVSARVKSDTLLRVTHPRTSIVGPLSWALVAIGGQLAMSVLTHAGKRIGYQHFLPLEGDGALARVAQALLVAQCVIVVAMLVVRRQAVAQLAVSLLPGWRLPAVAAAFVLTSGMLARDPRAYVLELVLASVVQVVQLATVAFIAASLVPEQIAALRRNANRILGLPSADVQPGILDRFGVVAAVWTVGIAYLLAIVAYQRHPHVPDEVVYLLHARYLAEGVLSMPLPPVPEAFNLDLMTYEPTRWFSPVPPGWPAMLAVGAWLGAPWLVNPILAGLNILLTYGVLREMYPRRTARLVVLLACSSPWLLFMAMNLMTHTFTLTCALGAALSVARLRRRGALVWAIAGGASLGTISLIRPLEAAAAAGLLGLWSLRARWRGIPLVPSAILTVSAAGVGALNLWYNRAMTGDARTFPIMQYTDRVFGPGTNALGFGPNRGLGWSGLDPYPGHGLRDVVVNTNLNVVQVNVELLGWSCGALVAVWILFASGRVRRPDWQMLAVVATIVGLHAFYWFSGGPDFGARYWFLVVTPMLVFAARGIEEADAVVSTEARAGALEVAAVLTVLSLVTFVPWRAVDKYYHYRGMRPDVRALAARSNMKGSLVLVRGNRHPDYHSAAAYNPLDLSARSPDAIFAMDGPRELRERLLAAYPGRPIWIIEGPSVTGGAFRVVSGPLTTDQLRALR